MLYGPGGPITKYYNFSLISFYMNSFINYFFKYHSDINYLLYKLDKNKFYILLHIYYIYEHCPSNNSLRDKY